MGMKIGMKMREMGMRMRGMKMMGMRMGVGMRM